MQDTPSPINPLASRAGETATSLLEHTLRSGQTATTELLVAMHGHAAHILGPSDLLASRVMLKCRVLVVSHILWPSDCLLVEPRGGSRTVASDGCHRKR